MPVFFKVLISNRGEIACRVIAACQAKGYRTVAVYTEVDAAARHTLLADEAICIGDGPVQTSYLNADAILEAARVSGADAVHPGYGFLSERAEFAERCQAAGITFIGPRAEAIRVMGDKATSKDRVLDAGVPCVPGYQGEDQSNSRLIEEATRIGYPIMVKASAGGGGRGMRLVDTADDLLGALKSARSEALGAFGDDRLLLERAIVHGRHVEIQIFGDEYGNVIHLGERDCSIQRRHQKVVEEAPSPAVDAVLRENMGGAACDAARAIGYVGAGTVEFLLDASGEFFFLEMNTRLQVEHPVTEMVTGVDLVALQLDVAAGGRLPLQQQDVNLTGHAIEARLYAEDTRNGFLPQAGQVLAWKPAEGAGVRIDHGLTPTTSVSPYYDPMLAKIIAFGADREEARRRLIKAIEDTVVLGVTTNKEFLTAVLRDNEFVGGAATTAFIAQRFPAGLETPAVPSQAELALAAILFVEGEGAGWRSNGWTASRLSLAHEASTFLLDVVRRRGGWSITHEGNDVDIAVVERGDGYVRCRVGPQLIQARFVRTGNQLLLDLKGRMFRFQDRTYVPAQNGAGQVSGAIRAPMTGLATAVLVEPGDAVKTGTLLIVIEAMKMEHLVTAQTEGIVDDVRVVPNQQVSSGDILISIVAAEAA